MDLKYVPDHPTIAFGSSFAAHSPMAPYGPFRSAAVDEIESHCERGTR